MRLQILPLVAIVGLATVSVPAFAQDAAVQSSPGHAHSHNQSSDETPFLTENNAAMDKMMAGMGVKPTGDVDADFTAMMIPHHQGAIDMAVAYLRYGKNEQLRRIAQEIIVDQQQEIAAMRLALGQPLPPPTAAPTQAVVPPANDAKTSPPSSSMMMMKMKPK